MEDKSIIVKKVLKKLKPTYLKIRSNISYPYFVEARDEVRTIEYDGYYCSCCVDGYVLEERRNYLKEQRQLKIEDRDPKFLKFDADSASDYEDEFFCYCDKCGDILDTKLEGLDYEMEYFEDNGLELESEEIFYRLYVLLDHDIYFGEDGLRQTILAERIDTVLSGGYKKIKEEIKELEKSGITVEQYLNDK